MCDVRSLFSVRRGGHRAHDGESRRETRSLEARDVRPSRGLKSGITRLRLSMLDSPSQGEMRGPRRKGSISELSSEISVSVSR